MQESSIANIVFVNYYGVGDLFNSREFVKDIMRQVPDKNFYYIHGKPEEIFEDIPIPKWEGEGSIIATTPTAVIGNSLFINTWIGRDSRYVLPGIGCKVGQNKQMFNDMLNGYGLVFEGENDYYWPKIDWERLRYNMFVERARWKNLQDKEFVIISNGWVNSSQSSNFDFNPVIDELTDKYPDLMFIETHKTGLVKPNLRFSGHLWPDIFNGLDVNYISSLALHSKLVVGRSSGPFTCCMTADFMNDFDRKALTFVGHGNAAYFIDNPLVAKARLKYITDMSNPIYHIEKVLNE